jgi:hypothetical protein
MLALRRALLLFAFAGAVAPARYSGAAEPTPPACPTLEWRTLQRGSLKDRMLVSHLETHLAITSSESGLPNDEKTDIIVAVADLGGDPRREMVVRLDGRAFCSAPGCGIYVLRKARNGHWVTVAEMTGRDLTTAATRTDGFCDLVLQDADHKSDWHWTGERYERVGPPTPPPTAAGSFP